MELMVVVFVLTIIMGGSFMVMSSGQAAWFLTDVNIRLEENLRLAFNRLTRELAETGLDERIPLNPILQLTILGNAGVNGSDILRFSMPVVCQNNVTVIDPNGYVAYWGAPLTWGCSSSSCMDADNDCATVDYKYLEYSIDNSNRLMRRVLDSNNVLVTAPEGETVVARNITDLQANPYSNNEIVTLTMTARAMSATNRLITTSKSVDVRLRN